jgi:RNA polymerase subunit RPABC4/transcription elongation factor Spt4
MALVKCPDCKREISDLAPTCLGCGRPMAISAATTTQQGHWEYKEFSAPITGTPRFRVDNNYFENIKSPIDAAVKSLLNRLIPLGWEPTEPTDYMRLFNADRIDRKRESSFTGLSSAHSTLIKVSINFRRWVTTNSHGGPACDSCGEAISNDMRFCPWCGLEFVKTISAKPPKAKQGEPSCGGCDGPIQDAMKYCPWCGSEFSEE